MAHQITNSDGLFMVREPAWHGLGTVLTDYPTREEAQRIAHPWEPISEPLFRRKAVPVAFGPERYVYEELEDFHLNARSDTNAPLGVNADSYVTITNSDMYDVAEQLQGESDDVMYETGGSLNGGKMVWLLLRLRDPLVIKGDPNGAVVPYYALQNSHDGGGSFRGQATMMRIVCANTSKAADLDSQAKGTEFVFHHTKNVMERVEAAKKALAGWRTSVNQWKQFADLMMDSQIDASDIDLFAEAFIPEPPAGLASNRVTANVTKARLELKQIINGETCEGIRLTAWGLIQGASEWSEHVRKANSQESRFKRAWLSRNDVLTSASRIARELASV